MNSAYATLERVSETALWSSYTEEWREFKKQETPDIEWKFWIKDGPYESIPYQFISNFCDSHTAGYWCHDDRRNFRVCNTCSKLPLSCWPLFIFKCDECDEPFLAKRYPIKYILCRDCGGDELNG